MNAPKTAPSPGRDLFPATLLDTRAGCNREFGELLPGDSIHSGPAEGRMLISSTVLCGAPSMRQSGLARLRPGESSFFAEHWATAYSKWQYRLPPVEALSREYLGPGVLRAACL